MRQRGRALQLRLLHYSKRSISGQLQVHALARAHIPTACSLRSCTCARTHMRARVPHTQIQTPTQHHTPAALTRRGQGAVLAQKVGALAHRAHNVEHLLWAGVGSSEVDVLVCIVQGGPAGGQQVALQARRRLSVYPVHGDAACAAMQDRGRPCHACMLR